MQSVFFLMVVMGIIAVWDTGKVDQYSSWNQYSQTVAGVMLDASLRAHTWCAQVAGGMCGQNLGNSYVPTTGTTDWFSTYGSTVDYAGTAATGQVKGFATTVNGQKYIAVYWQNVKDTESTNSQYGAVTAALLSKAPDGRYVGSWQKNGDPVGCFVSAGALHGQATQTICFGGSQGYAASVPPLSPGNNSPSANGAFIYGVPMILLPYHP